MRNAHYVEELEARARRVAEDKTHVAEAAAEPSLAPASRVILALALNELTRGLDGLSSCFNLLAPRPQPLRERLGLRLAQVEARRAARVSQSLRVLLEEPRLVRRPVNTGELLQRVFAEMSHEFALAHIEAKLESNDRLPAAWADGALVTVGISALLGAIVAMLESAEPPLSLRAGVFPEDQAVTVRIQADGPELPRDLSRLFDFEWVDRPGGVSSSTAFAAARRIAQLHGGTVKAEDQGGELVVSLTLPARE